jgi:hypothetical protein
MSNTNDLLRKLPSNYYYYASLKNWITNEALYVHLIRREIIDFSVVNELLLSKTWNQYICISESEVANRLTASKEIYLLYVSKNGTADYVCDFKAEKQGTLLELKIGVNKDIKTLSPLLKNVHVPIVTKYIGLDISNGFPQMHSIMTQIADLLDDFAFEVIKEIQSLYDINFRERRIGGNLMNADISCHTQEENKRPRFCEDIPTSEHDGKIDIIKCMFLQIN